MSKTGCCDFWGSSRRVRGLKIGSVKQNSSDLRDLIENYEEVSRRAGGHAVRGRIDRRCSLLR